MSEEEAAAAPPPPPSPAAADTKLPDWLDESFNPDGTRIVEGSTQTAWVSWIGDSPGFIMLEGDFTLAELREVVAMMEAGKGEAP